MTEETQLTPKTTIPPFVADQLPPKVEEKVEPLASQNPAENVFEQFESQQGIFAEGSKLHGLSAKEVIPVWMRMRETAKTPEKLKHIDNTIYLFQERAKSEEEDTIPELIAEGSWDVIKDLYNSTVDITRTALETVPDNIVHGTYQGIRRPVNWIIENLLTSSGVVIEKDEQGRMTGVKHYGRKEDMPKDTSGNKGLIGELPEFFRARYEPKTMAGDALEVVGTGFGEYAVGGFFLKPIKSLDTAVTGVKSLVNTMAGSTLIGEKDNRSLPAFNNLIADMLVAMASEEQKAKVEQEVMGLRSTKDYNEFHRVLNQAANGLFEGAVGEALGQIIVKYGSDSWKFIDKYSKLLRSDPEEAAILLNQYGELEGPFKEKLKNLFPVEESQRKDLDIPEENPSPFIRFKEDKDEVFNNSRETLDDALTGKENSRKIYEETKVKEEKLKLKKRPFTDEEITEYKSEKFEKFFVKHDLKEDGKWYNSASGKERKNIPKVWKTIGEKLAADKFATKKTTGGKLALNTGPQKELPFTPNDLENYYKPGQVNFEDSPLINLRKIDSSDQLKQVLNDAAATYENKFGKWEDDVLSNQQVETAAVHAREHIEQILGKGSNIDQFIMGFSNTTRTLPVHTLVVRDYLVDMTSNYHKLATEISDMGRLVDEGKLPEVPKVVKAKFMQETVRYLNMSQVIRGIGKDFGRSLQAYNIMAKAGADRGAAIDAILADSGQEAIGVMNLANAIASMKNPTGVQKLVGRSKVKKTFDALQYFAINGMLSSVTDDAVNIVSNMAFYKLSIFEDYISAGLNKVAKTFGRQQNGMEMDEVRAADFGTMQAFWEIFQMDEAFRHRGPVSGAIDAVIDLPQNAQGANELLNSFATKGGSSNRFLKKNGFRGFELSEQFSSAGFEIPDTGTGLNKWLRGMVDTTGFTVGVPGRMLFGGDQFSRVFFYRRAMHRLAMQRAIESGAVGYERVKLYQSIVKNLPEDIDKMAQDIAHKDVLQEDLPGVMQYVDKARRSRYHDKGRSVGKNIASNVATSFWQSHNPFLKTLFNAFKKVGYERNFLAIPFRRGLNKEKWMNDARYRDQVYAQSISGVMLLSLGVGLSKGIFSDEEHEVLMKTGGVALTNDRDFLYSSRRQPPYIDVTNKKTGDTTTYPIGRGDPFITLVTVGGALAEAMDVGSTINQIRNEGDTETADVLDNENYGQLAFTLGALLMDKSMMTGIRNTVEAVFPGPRQDPMKVATNYLNYLNPVQSGFSSLRRNIVKSKENELLLKDVPTEELVLDQKEVKTAYQGAGVYIPQKSELTIRQLKTWERMGELMIQDFVSKNIFSSDPQGIIKPMAGSTAILDMEGNVSRLHEETEPLYKRLLKQMAIPWHGRKTQESTTDFLVYNLKVPMKHPKRWKSYQGIPLSYKQRFLFAAEYGRLNRISIGKNKFFTDMVKTMKTTKDVPAVLMDAVRGDLTDLLNKNKKQAWQLVLSKNPKLALKYEEKDAQKDTQRDTGFKPVLQPLMNF